MGVTQTMQGLTGAERGSKAYGELMRLLHGAATLGSISALLSWDQETDMPPRAAGGRASQLSAMAGLAHERRTDERIGALLGECEQDAALTGDEIASANLREIRRDYDRARKLPGSLVSELAQTSSEAMEAWKAARAKSDWSMFEPWMEKTLSLHRRKAECYGAPEGGELYDALIEDFEPGTLASEIERIFDPLREELKPLIREAMASSRAPSDAPHHARASIEAQKALNRRVSERIGFDFEAGALEVSTHPFTSGIAPGDTRMTTRYREDRFAEALLTTLHEAGHALYEQNLPKAERFGQPLADSVSLGIHESQSRMWENFVGRSLSFWEWCFPIAAEALGSEVGAFSPEEMHGAVNILKPHFIRVESDEATYNLHVMLRFDIEKALLREDIRVSDIPGFWNERMKKDLGLEVKEDRDGCLQDVHWSMGAIGYFPTYTLGTLHAAQMWEAINEQIPNLEASFRKGDFQPVLAWVVEHIHQEGRRWRANELIERLTGRALSHEPLMRHLRGKYGALYGLE